jgi:hypothetical protein
MEVGADFASNSCALVVVNVCVDRCTDRVYVTSESSLTYTGPEETP